MSNALRACIVSASGQNVFFAEILDAFAAALRDHGLTVEESVDHFPPPADDLVYLFIPHEYHPLVHQLAHPTVDQLQRTVAICTEQPGTAWFDTSIQIATQSAAAVDINMLGVNELERRGVRVEYAPLGYVPDWDVWHGADRGRSVSLTFLGAYTERRSRVLAGCVPALRGRRSAIHLSETTAPHTAGNRSFLAGDRKWRLLADSHVLLNVHQANRPYMEWARVIGAVINGCVVLSEHSVGVEPLVPGQHFLTAGYDDLGRVLDGVLNDPDRLHRIRHAAYDLLKAQMPMSTAADALLRAVERAGARPVPSKRRIPAGPMPLPPPERKPGWEADAEIIGAQLPLRTALKHLLVQSRRLERQIQDLSRGSESLDGVTIEQLGPDCPDARVSVLLTIYNYADYVGQALRSVALSDLDDVEVVAVDDASSDGSAEAVHAACADLPWLPVRLLRRKRNHGLSAARNLAAKYATSDLLFILDADNMVLPTGISTLAAALDANPDAAFAYGLIQKFDPNGPRDVVSWLDWDPTRLRYGNYIDAMAMVRRTALEEVGGYSTDPALSMGWEDFALWAGIAHHGMRGICVPDFVARYRMNPYSMLSLTDIDSSAVWATLLRKYPSLSRVGETKPPAQAA